MGLVQTPIEEYQLKGKTVYVKRDAFTERTSRFACRFRGFGSIKSDAKAQNRVKAVSCLG